MRSLVPSTSPFPGPTTATVETWPGESPAARMLAPALRNATWLIRNTSGGPPVHKLLRFAGLSDFSVGLLQPAPAGTTTTPVQFGGFTGELVHGPGVTRDDGVVLYFHGGAFICCGLRSHRRLVARISAASGLPVLNVDYRQLPAATLAQSIADCVHAYQLALLRGYSADRIVFAGDSAGGYLAFATALRAVQQGLPAPAGIATLSPWLDLECTHSLTHPNGLTDPYLPVRRIGQLLGLLYGNTDPVPPLVDSDLSGLPPTLIQVSSIEALLPDAEIMTDKLAEHQVDVRLQVWEGQVHVFQAFADLVPEGFTAINQIGGFIAAQIGRVDQSVSAA
ncbi:MAG TPA: alpha/beta hydrolase [Pseudonocardia sp.]|nr:alpha/beta hydrolase [Pseudonocardia sp.]